MALVKLTLQGFLDGRFEKAATAPYPVFINPESFSRTSTNAYDTSRPAGAAGEAPRFISASEGPLAFSLLLDGTRAIDGRTIEVEDELRRLRGVVFDYHGSEHSPYFVQVSWGTLLFKGRLTTFTVNYTLFRPNGSPVRAKVDLELVSYTDPAELALHANNQSADLTHHHRVLAGDTLPLLCYRIYGSARYYPQVARANGLAHVGRLIPGTMLVFPPLVSTTTRHVSPAPTFVRPDFVYGDGRGPGTGWLALPHGY